ncbi:MAG TPA: sigma-70 family RNA polymerase sigma factor [Solirubrobacteraceae bacterium]|nr:sigma-70 family RNA polymerase sigma factor [Solirubrobacteraceae bacterium]
MNATQPTRPVSARDERALVEAAQSGCERSRAELTDHFSPRIAFTARDYRAVRAVSREELMQAGVLGLLRALERWDPKRENNFWSYARWWVRQAMQELVSSQNGVVVLSDRALRQLARVNSARLRHLQSQQREPTTQDLAASTGIPSSQVMMLIGAAQPARGLDEGTGTERIGARPVIESLSDPAGEDAFDHATLRVAARGLPKVLETLTPRELTIVRGRYGIGGEQRSVSDLAAALGVSNERVRQIERAAIGKLRQSFDGGVLAA